MQVVRASDSARLPTRGSPGSAGLDLYSAHNCEVPPRGKKLISTDLKVRIPNGCYGRIAPRSGLALRHAIDVGAGVVDSDYRGIVSVLLFNHSDEPFNVETGNRIAQLICEKICYVNVEEVHLLNQTVRGVGGFGSTSK